MFGRKKRGVTERVVREFRQSSLLSMRDALGFDFAGLVSGKTASHITVFFDVLECASDSWCHALTDLEGLEVIQEFSDGQIHMVALTFVLTDKGERKQPSRALARLAGWSVQLHDLPDCEIAVVGADALQQRLASWFGNKESEFPRCAIATINSEVGHIAVAGEHVAMVECPLADLGQDDPLEAVLRDLGDRDEDVVLTVITRPYQHGGGRRSALVQLHGVDDVAVADLVTGLFEVVDLEHRLRLRRVRGWVRLAWFSSLPVGVLAYAGLSPAITADIRKVMA